MPAFALLSGWMAAAPAVSRFCRTVAASAPLGRAMAFLPSRKNSITPRHSAAFGRLPQPLANRIRRTLLVCCWYSACFRPVVAFMTTLPDLDAQGYQALLASATGMGHHANDSDASAHDHGDGGTTPTAGADDHEHDDAAPATPDHHDAPGAPPHDHDEPAPENEDGHNHEH